jgi:putative ABC transport system permease protein
MSLWRQLQRGVRALVNRPVTDREIDDELRHFLDQSTAEKVARGFSPDDARRSALVEMGNVTANREQVRSHGWENAVEQVFADVRYAVRRLARSPGFTVVAVTTLALGVGASTAIFSVVYPVLFQPLPYVAADRLVQLDDQMDDGSPLPMTYGNYREVSARSHSLTSVAAYRAWQPALMATGDNSRPEIVEGETVTANFFSTLGVAPAFGRDFDASDDVPNGRQTIVISDGLWRRAFGADSAIIGRTVMLDGASYAVVGVLPSRFESLPGTSASVWTLLQFPLTLPSEGIQWGHNLRVIGRMKPGFTVDEARRDLASIGATPVAEFVRPPWSSMKRGLRVASLRDYATGAVRPALLAVLGAVALVLLIACVNVTNLLLARGAQRHGELAMRAALGAERPRLIRQLVTESLVLALVSGVIGVAIASVGVAGLLALAPTDLPRRGAIGVSGSALLFTVVISTIVGVVIGIVPAIQLARHDLRTSLQRDSRRTAAGSSFSRRALVVAEVSLALVLLVNAGLLWRTLSNLFAVNPGMSADHLLTMRVSLSGARYDADSAVYTFFDRATAAARAVPGVKSVALVSELPLSGDDDEYGAHFESSPTGRDESQVVRYAVSADFFSTMGIPMRAGRAIDENDRGGGEYAVVLNQSFAKRKFPAGNAIGQRLHLGPDRGPWFRVVGVAGDVKQLSLAGAQSDAAYISTRQSWFADPSLWFIVQTVGDETRLAPSIERAIWSVDRTQPITRVASMRAVVAASAAQRRFTLIIFEVFAIVALILAATGIYGVLAGGVAERTREIGVRTALGASTQSILGLVLGQGLALTAIGIVLGLGGAFAATRGLRTLLFGVTALDPLTYLAVSGTLALVAVIACWVPAARAAAVDPTITLRSD